MPTTSGDAIMNNDTAAIATLNIRTTSLEREVNELRVTVTGVQSALSTKIDSLATSLSSKIDERGKTPWQYIISGVAVIFSLYAYIDNSKIGPLKEADDRVEKRMDRISNKMETDVVPRSTLTREWQQNDERFARMEERIKFGEAAQIDRIKRVEELYGNSFNLRDALQQLDQRMRQVEGQKAGPARLE